MAVRLRIEMRHILPQWNLCLNSDGDTGAFFRVKNYRREFFARKPSA